MKKRKLKLGLNKIEISNLKSLKGGNNTGISDCIYCVDTSIQSDNGDCEETDNCETQGGYACGETVGAFCGYRTYEVYGCR